VIYNSNTNVNWTVLMRRVKLHFLSCTFMCALNLDEESQRLY